MNLFKILGEKSWIPQPVGTDFSLPEHASSQRAGRVALNFFIAVVSVIFFLFTITFLTRSQIPDFRPLAGEPWQPLTDTTQLWINTAAIVFSSLMLYWAKRSAKKQHFRNVQIGVLLSVLSAFFFLFGQLLVWQHLSDLGYYMTTHPAASYFYLLTAIHGLHLLGGLIVLLFLLGRVNRLQERDTVAAKLKLCERYWNFLLILWGFLFALLTASPETYNIIAQLCGF